MAVSRLYLVNPYNDTHIQMIQEYEQRNSIPNSTSESLKETQKTPEEIYLTNKRDRNEIEERLFIEKDSLILDSCLIQGEKDIKTGRITLFPKTGTNKKRKIVLLAVDYAFKTLNLEEVFVMLNPKEKETIRYLREQGYEFLGEEQGNILFLKEKEERIKRKRMIA